MLPTSCYLGVVFTELVDLLDLLVMWVMLVMLAMMDLVVQRLKYSNSRTDLAQMFCECCDSFLISYNKNNIQY